MSKYFDKLFILELANNHNGDVETAKEIIKQASEICEPYKQYGFQFAIKLQYRDLDTFIHPDFKGNHDYKFVKRFEETKLTWSEFKEIKDYAKEKGFITACTPFDEIALQKVIEHDFDIVKIASCSFTDWPLLEEIVKHDKPIIASCGAAELEDIDRVVDFMEHRGKEFALLHCVPEYPTKDKNYQVGQIDFLQNRYSNIKIGLSEHSEFGVLPELNTIYERHICLKEGNSYSTPIRRFDYTLEKYLQYINCTGETKKRHSIPQSQKDTIRSLQRGAYSKIPIREGSKLQNHNVFFAMPLQKGQLSANDFSKYKEFIWRDYYHKDLTIAPTLGENEPIMLQDLIITDKRQQVLDIVQKLIPIIKESGVVLPDRCEMELSHHFGIERFEEWGATIFNVINREYCKKIILMLPDQKHPEHYHDKKIETFHILYGNLMFGLDGKIDNSNTTEKSLITVTKNVRHWFQAFHMGCVFEEISTTHYSNDSFYSDENVHENRKTKLTWRSEWVEKGVK